MASQCGFSIMINVFCNSLDMKSSRTSAKPKRHPCWNRSIGEYREHLKYIGPQRVLSSGVAWSPACTTPDPVETTLPSQLLSKSKYRNFLERNKHSWDCFLNWSFHRENLRMCRYEVLTFGFRVGAVVIGDRLDNASSTMIKLRWVNVEGRRRSFDHCDRPGSTALSSACCASHLHTQ